MADITLSSGDTVRPHRSPWGAFPIVHGILSTGVSSQTIAVGQLVALDVDSTSYQNCVRPSSISSGTVLSTAVVGFAAESPGARSSTNTQGTIIPIWEANPSVEYRGRTRGALLNSTIVGQPKNLDWDSTLGIHLVNVGAGALTTAHPLVVVTGLIDNSGDSGGAVTFRFVRQALEQLSSTAPTIGAVLAYYR